MVVALVASLWVLLAVVVSAAWWVLHLEVCGAGGGGRVVVSFEFDSPASAESFLAELDDRLQGRRCRGPAGVRVARPARGGVMRPP